MEPSTSAGLHHTPDNIIYLILREMGRTDLLKCKLISRRFQRIIRHNAAFLARPVVSELFVQMREAELRSTKTGKVVKTSRHHCIQLRKKMQHSKSRKYLNIKNEDFLNGLETALKSYSISKTITLDGIEINAQVLSEFIRPTSDFRNVENVNFVLACFKQTNHLLERLLEGTNCRNLSFEFCSDVQNVINDTLFKSIQTLESLNIVLAEPVRLVYLTNSSLDRWTDQDELPTRIKLDNSTTGFTVDGIFKLIQKLILAYQQQKMKSSIDWSFGRIEASPADLLSYIQRPSTRPPGYNLRLRAVQANHIRAWVDIDSKQGPVIESTPLAELEKLARFGSAAKTEHSCLITFDVITPKV
ncbi:unnamed protein product [Bursaphelenchus xylophilus]|uniref:(pine wood nematode) hypothetical protein n=1 Tax=Bursaphelenchus xylophilus TaxID=6326 RepID=A0A1I7RXL0_BURXY|nr:unnamed protein product [Bursaphelenchus xylophilus]CAG9126544.1 unnamed protein product [Bursaphelenchus xylophilus]